MGSNFNENFVAKDICESYEQCTRLTNRDTYELKNIFSAIQTNT